MWFLFALATTLLWGSADLFYKKGAGLAEKYTHLKTAICVGLVMGVEALITLISIKFSYNFLNILIYLPVSLMYMLSMIIGYYGLKFLRLSVSSPIQNSSGAVTCILCIIFLKQFPGKLSLFAVILISIGVLFLGIIEKKEEDENSKSQPGGDSPVKSQAGGEKNKKYTIGFIAFFMPVIYCVIDSLGTFFDAFYLDDAASTPLILGNEDYLEQTANISYEMTFFICALLLLIYLIFIKKESFSLNKQGDRATAAVFEALGQGTYVYAMSSFAAVAAPMIASYSIISLILSRIFLKERLSLKQYISVILVLIGIVILGITGD